MSAALPPQLSNVSNTSSVPRGRANTSTGRRPPLAGSSSFAASSQRTRPQTDQSSRAQGWTPSPTPSFPGTGSEIGQSSSRRQKPKEPTDEEQALVFDRMYDALMREESGFVGELERFLSVHESLKASKQKALYNSWESDVFDKCNEQIGAAVNARSARDVSNRRAALMQEYLNVSNKKTFGVFRDIIIEAEYDPLHSHKDHITYNSRVSHDPCKLELRKSAQRDTGTPRAEFQRVPGPEPRLDVAMWAQLEATPYGRLGKVVPRAEAEPYALANRITTDQYHMPTGRAVLLRELPLGKRCFPGAGGPPQWP